MPNGRVHAIATTVAAGVLGPAAYFAGHQPAGIATALALGCAAGLLITPDLDIRHDTESQYLVRKAGGCLVGAVWDWFWWPYSHWLIPRHRHPLSHMPLLGTALRVFYFGGLPLLIWWLLHAAIPADIPSPVIPQVTLTLWWALAGLAIADTLHTSLDTVYPPEKRRR